jgi:hypothetical protein
VLASALAERAAVDQRPEFVEQRPAEQRPDRVWS